MNKGENDCGLNEKVPQSLGLLNASFDSVRLPICILLFQSALSVQDVIFQHPTPAHPCLLPLPCHCELHFSRNIH